MLCELLGAKKVTEQQNNQPIVQPLNPQHDKPLCNQRRLNQPTVTDEHIKQIILEFLIELNLVAKPTKKKVLSNV
jgi:hypothetical protein